LKIRPNILVCPLEWGIGHATRCVPLIKELLKQDTNVIIGASGRPLAFLKNEFPQLSFIDFPGYSFTYPGRGSMAFKMLLQIPSLFKGARNEHKFLDKIIDQHKIDIVISDNRFGLWTKKVPCVYMTHQVFIKSSKKLKFLEPILYKIHKHYMSKYNEVWIPDFENENNLSGDLSHLNELPSNFYFVGPQSRFFSSSGLDKQSDFKYDVLCLLSGPEPQRTLLEKKIIEQLKDLNLRVVIVAGKPEVSVSNQVSENLKIYSHLDTETLKQLIIESEVVIARPGYSTIMDLVSLNKRAIFIPTPGQTEQEYLASKFKKEKNYFRLAQNDFNLPVALEQSKNYSGKHLPYDNILLTKRITTLLRN